ncbi:MAG: LiaI-LiaF-like domain-containing protein [Anaerolineae bacterium]
MSDIQEPIESVRRPRRSPPSFFWPLVLVGTGIILLLSNLGYLPWQSWNVLWRLWPLLLVALGIDVLIGHRSMLGALVSGLLILLLFGCAVTVALFAQNVPALVELSQPVEWHTEHIEHPLGSVESSSVIIDWTSAPAYLSALPDSSANLIEGDIAYRGQLTFDVDVRGSRANVELDSHFSGPWFGPVDFGDRAGDRWDVKLSPQVPLNLALDAGSGHCDFDLTGLQIDDLFLDGGSGAIDLTLPAASTFEARIDGGSGSITIVLPEGVGARVVLDSGSGSFRPDERFQLVEGERDGDGIWETDDYDMATHTVVLRIDQGSGSISIVER